ncbi:MAG: DUF3079 domain-containing protein [Cyanobacteria bacterium]|nr:DUF3079 domain-containing protein [Cyanobacteriota bacterium]
MKTLKDEILHPKHPERICWGCDRYCPIHDLACGNDTIRAAHLVELFGEDWFDWAERRPSNSRLQSTPAVSEKHG